MRKGESDGGEDEEDDDGAEDDGDDLPDFRFLRGALRSRRPDDDLLRRGDFAEPKLGVVVTPDGGAHERLQSEKSRNFLKDPGG